jgi:hypothetical protein
MHTRIIEGKKYRSARAAARYLLTSRKYRSLTQTSIAKRLHVTLPCVNQVATELAAR